MLCYLHMKDLLKQLPSVDEVLKESRVREWLEQHPRVLVLEAIRSAVDRKRKTIVEQASKGGADVTVSLSAILESAGLILGELSEPSLRPLINATGVVVHTNLGRSILPEAAIERIIEVNRSYSNLEYDIRAGERGKRHIHIEAILRR